RDGKAGENERSRIEKCHPQIFTRSHRTLHERLEHQHRRIAEQFHRDESDAHAESHRGDGLENSEKKASPREGRFEKRSIQTQAPPPITLPIRFSSASPRANSATIFPE